MKLFIINGPNLNLLGVRERGIYGNSNFESYLTSVQVKYKNLNINYYQSNIEGEIVNKLHEVGFSYDGVILNAGAYTHTSVAIRDAISAINTSVVEVHISNILTRENFRHESIIGPACRGGIMGFGLDSYRLAIESYLAD